MQENLGIVGENVFISLSARENELMLFYPCLFRHSMGRSVSALSSLHSASGCMIVDLIPVNQCPIVPDHVLFSFDL
jgi:hypothetical protein